MNNGKKESIFAKKIEPEYRRVFNFVYSRVKYNKELAQDLTQSTMELAWYKLEQVRKEDCYKSWVMQIAANEVKRYYKAQEAQKRGTDKQVPYEQEEVDQIVNIDQTESDTLMQIVKKEESEAVIKALLKMDDPYKMIIELRMFYDLKFSEIGEMVDLKESTTRVYYARALESLKKEYCLMMGGEK